MPYASDKVNSPQSAPDLYRPAIRSDISDVRILGFYRWRGAYHRKNGGPRASILGYHVRLDEILTEENAPPERFELTRITVNTRDAEALQKFGYLLGARGYLHPVLHSDDRYVEEMALHFLDAVLVPPTRLLNLLDDCIAAQKDWGEEKDE